MNPLRFETKQDAENYAATLSYGYMCSAMWGSGISLEKGWYLYTGPNQLIQA